MNDLRLEYPLKLTAFLFVMSTSGFYRWLKRKPTRREYIEIFYNRQRKQAKLGYLSPTAYEKQYYQQLAAA